MKQKSRVFCQIDVQEFHIWILTNYFPRFTLSPSLHISFCPLSILILFFFIRFLPICFPFCILFDSENKGNHTILTMTFAYRSTCYFLMIKWKRCPREYWRIYRGSGFLAVVWLGSSPPSPPPPVSKLDRRHTARPRKRDNLLTGEGRGGVGEERNHKTARRKPSPL